MRPTVILVWTTRVCNVPSTSFWGLGDIIRGTIHVFQLSKKRNFKLIVDIQLHPVAQFLKARPHEHSGMIRANKDKICFFPHIERHLGVPLFIGLTNDKYKEPITAECQAFVRDIMTPNEMFRRYMLEKSTGPTVYTSLHFRLGDQELVHQVRSSFQKYADYLDKHPPETPTILVSDSQAFKSFVRDRFPAVFMFDTQVGHLGYHTDAEKTRDTLFEFFTLTKSTLIKTYCVYRRRSGFVAVCADVYNVPVVDIRI